MGKNKRQYKGRYIPNMFGSEPIHEEFEITEIIEEKKGKKIIQTRIVVKDNNNPNAGIDANAFKLDELIKTGNFIKAKPIQEDIMDMRERAEHAFNSAWEKASINKFMNS